MTKHLKGQYTRYEAWARARAVEKYNERREQEQLQRQRMGAAQAFRAGRARQRRTVNQVRRHEENTRRKRSEIQKLLRENVRAKKEKVTNNSLPEVILENARRDVAAASSAVKALASAGRGVASDAIAAAEDFRSAPLNADKEEEEVEERVEDVDSMMIESDEEGDESFDAPRLLDGAGLGWDADDSAADLRAPGLLRDFANYGRLFNGVSRVRPLRF